MKVKLSFFYYVLIVFACEPASFNTAEELSAYITSSENLTQSQEVNDYRISITYKPTDLLVHQEVEGGNPRPALIDSLRNKYASHYYFMLSLSRGNNEALTMEGNNGFSELVQTLSFRMGSYVTLTTSKSDTIPVADFILNRTYGMSRSTDLLFVFNKKNAEGQEWVQFNLNEFGLNTGNQRFRFRAKDLENAPHVEF